MKWRKIRKWKIRMMMMRRRKGERREGRSDSVESPLNDFFNDQITRDNFSLWRF